MVNFSMFKLDLEKAEEPEVKLEKGTENKEIKRSVRIKCSR